MPITSSAKKKMRSDKGKRAHNLQVKNAVKQAVKRARREPSPENLCAAQKVLDKAVGSHLVHKNKAARLKSRLTKRKTA
ncbi:MAG: 30S ribosomal protein S20 [Patescibacteria group bacterium]